MQLRNEENERMSPLLKGSRTDKFYVCSMMYTLNTEEDRCLVNLLSYSQTIQLVFKKCGK